MHRIHLTKTVLARRVAGHRLVEFDARNLVVKIGYGVAVRLQICCSLAPCRLRLLREDVTVPDLVHVMDALVDIGDDDAVIVQF